MASPTKVLHQPERHSFGQSPPRLDVRVVFVVGEFLALGAQPRGDPLDRGTARPVRTEHLPEKRPGRQQRSVDDSLPRGPFLREDQCEVFGRENLAQTEIKIRSLLLVQAKDLVLQPGRGRV